MPWPYNKIDQLVQKLLAGENIALMQVRRLLATPVLNWFELTWY